MSELSKSAVSAPGPGRQRPFRILVIDDSISVQRAVKEAFRDQPGFAVSACGDVASGEHMLTSAPTDLILCDVVLPGPSGYDLCSRIKKERTNLPVLLLTSAFEPFDEKRARQVRADGIVGKPFTAAQLRQTVLKTLKQHAASAVRFPNDSEDRSNAALSAVFNTKRGAASSGTQTTPSAAQGDLPTIQSIDIVNKTSQHASENTMGQALDLDELTAKLLEPLAARLMQPVVERLAARLDGEKLPAPIQRIVSQVAERLIRRRLEELETGEPSLRPLDCGDPPKG